MKKNHFKTAQSTLEYSLIAALVVGGIMMMGPYVIRSINAHMHTWESDVRDSLTERYTQEEPQGIELPTCECGVPVPEGCGICLAPDACPTRCSRTERKWDQDCNPPGCEAWMALKGGSLPALPGRDGCVSDPDCCYDEPVGCATSPCAVGEMHWVRRCGGGVPDVHSCVADPSCDCLCLPHAPPATPCPSTENTYSPCPDRAFTYVLNGNCPSFGFCVAQCPAGWLLRGGACCNPNTCGLCGLNDCGLPCPDLCPATPYSCDACLGGARLEQRTCVDQCNPITMSCTVQTVISVDGTRNCGLGCVGEHCHGRCSQLPWWRQARCECDCSGPGTTPFLFTNINGQYIIENDVLTTVHDQSHDQAKTYYEDDKPNKFGLEPTDNYIMRRNPTVHEEGIKLLLKEIEPEESYIDQIKLVRAVYDKNATLIEDYQTGQFKAVNKERIQDLVSCEYKGESCKESLLHMDRNYIPGKKGDEMYLKFSTEKLRGKSKVYFTLNSWGNFNYEFSPPFSAEGCAMSIIAYVYDPDNVGNYTVLKRIHLREFEARHYLDITDIVNRMPGKEIGIKLMWTLDHYVDYTALVVVEESPFKKEELALLEAEHDKDGDIRVLVLNKDKEYGHLVPGDEIKLLFAKPKLKMGRHQKDGYAFVISGFFHALRGDLYPRDVSNYKEKLAGYAKELKEFYKENNIILDIQSENFME